jgi:hypothetical protein
MAANKVEQLPPPRYVAFRTMQNWVVVPVIARIESVRSGRVWGCWFSQDTPEGDFKELPVEDVVALESDDDAEELIRLIRGGRELPAEFVQRLHVIAD